MEILDLKFAGIPVWIILLVAAICYNGRYAFREWRKDREMVREVEAAQRKFKAEHEWKPRMVGGVDCGEWVCKDGRPVGIDH
ncbi:MAG: hypothetical protein WBF73_12470 [Bradyrhizobium sp.]